MISQEEDEIALLALHTIPKLGGASIRHLISHLGSAKNVLAATLGKLKSINGIGESRARLITQSSNLKKAELIHQSCKNNNIRILSYLDQEYPTRLKQCQDAPIILFAKGKSIFNESKVVSIVGTRNATAYGREVTKEIVKFLKNHHVVIASGLAYGIDITAHIAALNEGMDTIAALAGGFDHIYPPEHRVYIDKIVEQGAILSEYIPDEKPEPGKFPARNRIIAGIADATIVVEASKKGGALITADIANSYDREVIAVPGNIHKESSKGCNELIKRNQAHILSSPEDIMEILNWDIVSEQFLQQTIANLESLNEDEKKIISLLNEEKYRELDTLSYLSGINLNQLAGLLLNLEFQGLVRSLPGKKYTTA